ncbi:MAG: hypothetical protein KDI16_07405 [Halioglobus sp.]|nr:hypothetical protein [Halioglobus sp.]
MQETQSCAYPAVGERLQALLGSPVETGNAIETLVNGQRIFPAMLRAIEEARHEICFETFIYWSGDIAGEFADALSAAAKRGVAVQVLLDWWGAQKMDDELIEQMRAAGARVRYFNPLRWWQLHRLNYRTHRKILVVDRQVAFTGGVGIAQVWCGDARAPDEWHDLHYRIAGPVVRCFQQAFQELWCEVLAEPALSAAAQAPAPPDAKRLVAAQVLTSSPRSGAERVYRVFRYAIEHARNRVQLVTAYFVPDREMIGIMLAALRRGVEFEVMVPGKHIDADVVRYSSRSSWGALLRAGVQIHVYDPTMLHAKVMVVDDDWVLIGSANFDNRSFSLNDEVLVNVFSEPFAAQHRELFAKDCERCHRLSYDEWRHRGLTCRIKEFFANRLRAHL